VDGLIAPEPQVSLKVDKAAEAWAVELSGTTHNGLAISIGHSGLATDTRPARDAQSLIGLIWRVCNSRSTRGPKGGSEVRQLVLQGTRANTTCFSQADIRFEVLACDVFWAHKMGVSRFDHR
jgi:hypothetical protein